MNNLFPAAFAALAALPAPALYQTVHEGHDHVQGTGTVNSVDQAARKVNLSHGAIPQIGWPAMTMDFPVAPSVDLKAVTPGMRFDFTLDRGPDGAFVIETLTPVK
jgi:Cu(I)/Ag(I) efflux system periplasmic protein CusF